MSDFQIRIELADGSEYAKGGLSLEAAQAIESAVLFVLEGVGAVFVEPEQWWSIEVAGGADEQTVEVLVMEDGDFLSEYEQGWANIRADERAAVARQVAEDIEYERQQASVPYYMGIRGSLEPDGGYIFEP